jgi:hypothetical protein
MSTATQQMPNTGRLWVNQSGAWRFVMTVNPDNVYVLGAVEALAAVTTGKWRITDCAAVPKVLAYLDPESTEQEGWYEA